MELSSLVLILTAVVVAVILGFRRRRTGKLGRTAVPSEKGELPLTETLKDRSQIVPLPDFDLNSSQPLRHRPFKPIYYITMALQSSSPSDLITMDTNYEERVLGRRRILAENPSIAMGATPEGHESVKELYTYVMRDYLPIRFPRLFRIFDNGASLYNTVTGVSSPLQSPGDPLDAFKILGETVEDDMFLLHETELGHRVVAFVCCHPSGFDPSSKLGKLLTEVHGPVPAYEKIAASMERFFSRLEVNKSVKRMNWSVTTKPELFSPNFNHVGKDEIVDEEDIDMEEARLRIELQTLTRLPKTKAILFSFKTYLYPVKEIKEEGLGPDLADAIEGIKLGNAPGMWTYKGAGRWGNSVCEYLRS